MVFFLMARTSSGVPHRTKTAKRWMDGWMDGWVDGWMDGWVRVCVDGWVDA